MKQLCNAHSAFIVKKDEEENYLHISGSASDSANWNLQCDSNEDSKASVSDLGILGKTYGRTS
jgi:hypothetical protein